MAKDMGDRAKKVGNEKSLAIQWVKPSQLIPYGNNAKTHPQEQIELIANQIKSFGFDQPIVVDKKMVIIKGHGRLLASKLLGLKEVPIYVAKHLTAEQARLARLGDNKSAESAWDFDLLNIEFKGLKDLELDLSALTGFSAQEISMINDQWVSNIAKVESIEAHSDGINVTIKVTCPQTMKEQVIAAIYEAISEAKLEGVEVG